MTREESRRLLAGYATGSLNESERRLLFEAALDDQDLFDELAHEQALKELLDQPDAKQRLIAALRAGKPAGKRPTWKRPLIWSVAAIIAIGIGMIYWNESHAAKPVSIAAVQTPEPLASPVPPSPVPASPESKEAKPSPPPKTRSIAPKRPPAPSPGKDVQQEEAKKEPSIQQMAPAPSPASGFAAGSQPLATPLASPRIARGLQPPPPISFDYTIRGQTLDLQFGSSGYVSIRFTPGEENNSISPVAVGSSREDAIPDSATEATIIFAVSTDASGGVSVSRNEGSGRVVDPSGKRIELKLRLK